MNCQNCGREIAEGLEICQLCGAKTKKDPGSEEAVAVSAKSDEEEHKGAKLKKVIRIFLYIILAMIFFTSWSIRQDFIVGTIPVVIHLGIFFGLFYLVKKIR